MPFEFHKTAIEGLLIVQPKVFPDNRGEFSEIYKYSDFATAGITDRFVQTNYSKSKKGVLRGMHYQLAPMAQAKLVRVTSGSVFDVAVDMRKSSSTYGKWFSVTLTSELKNMLYISEGFAHGFCVLEDDTQVVYNCTKEYSPEHERGVIWNDSAIGITWPITDPIIAERDANYPKLENSI